MVQNARATATACYLVTLPVELHFYIRTLFVRDPDTSFKDFKTLRLVCKMFDAVWSPVVLSNVAFFQKEDDILDHLRHLSHAANDSLAAARTLTIRNWHCLGKKSHSVIEDVRDLNGSPSTRCSVGRWTATLALNTIAMPVKFVQLLAKPKEIPRRLKASSDLIQARRYATRLRHKLNMPNVRCIRLLFRRSETKWPWVVHRFSKMLLALPQLTEMELHIPDHADISYIARCLSGTCTLRKFTVMAYCNSQSELSRIEHFRTVIARNLGLTHLVLVSQGHICDFTELLRDVPTNRPLKLEHVCLTTRSKLSRAILPHFLSLKSLSSWLTSGPKEWCTLFAQADIFPPTIQVMTIEEENLAYLRRHPGIVSLAFTNVKLESASGLYQVLDQHAKTIRYLVTTTPCLAATLNVIENEMRLSRCTNLQELVLYPHGCGQIMEGKCCPIENITSEKVVLPIIARLSCKLTVVIANNGWIFNECIAYCRASDNPLLRNLTQRIVFERRVDIL